MSKIKKVLICGLGAIGGYYASKISQNTDVDLRVLTDKDRYEKYMKTPRIINGKEYTFNYILPYEKGYSADLVIVATKSSGLNLAIENLRNFVSDGTIILSFMNGISSERKIAEEYGYDKILYSYLLGHTFFRTGREINHDGNANVVFGSNIKDDIKVAVVREFFDDCGIQYKIPNDIINSLWNKFCFNCCANQLSALTGQTFGQLRTDSRSLEIMEHITREVSLVAQKEGITCTDDFWENTKKSLDIMIPDGKTSMLQDVEAGVRPEVDIFGGTVVELGKKHGVEIVYNKIISDLINLRTDTNVPCLSFVCQAK